MLLDLDLERINYRCLELRNLDLTNFENLKNKKIFSRSKEKKFKR